MHIGKGGDDFSRQGRWKDTRLKSCAPVVLLRQEGRLIHRRIGVNGSFRPTSG